MRTTWLPFATALAFLGAVAHAEPEKRAARMIYTRGDLTACPDEEAMKNAVTARLGYDPFDPEAKEIVTAQISRTQAGLRGQVDMRDQALAVKGSRTLTSDKSDCAELALAMTLAISIAIDPHSITRPTSTPTPTPTSTPPSTPTTTSTPIESPTPTGTPALPPTPLVLRAGVDLGGAVALVPGPVFLGTGALGVGYGPASLDLEAMATFASTASAPKGDVSASLLVISLAPCFHTGVAMGCALVGMGQLYGQGEGVTSPRSDGSLYANAGARLGLEFPLASKMSLRVRVDGLVPLTHTRLELNGSEVWSTPPVAVTAGAGVLFHFP